VVIRVRVVRTGREAQSSRDYYTWTICSASRERRRFPPEFGEVDHRELRAGADGEKVALDTQSPRASVPRAGHLLGDDDDMGDTAAGRATRTEASE
jgi:hypothetical protein